MEYLSELDYETDSEIGDFLIKTTARYKYIDFIDFNYTEIMKKKYLPIMKEVNKHTTYRFVNIHGSISGGNIVFGYGNDQDEKYQELKALEKDMLLEHFKTIEYNCFQNIFMNRCKILD